MEETTLLITQEKNKLLLRMREVHFGDFYVRVRLISFKHLLARSACGKSLMIRLLATELSKTIWQQKGRDITSLTAAALQNKTVSLLV